MCRFLHTQQFLCCRSSCVEHFAIVPLTGHELQAFQEVTERTCAIYAVVDHGGLSLIVLCRLEAHSLTWSYETWSYECFCVYSPALTASLRQLARTIPELRKDLLEGLLKMLSVVLLGRPLQHPGAPRPKAASLPSSMSTPNLQDLPDVATITLALRTLGSFDFEGISVRMPYI